MSLETWMREFYPISAEKATRTWKMAVEHSLRKWIGLREDNLKKHKLHKSDEYIIHKKEGVFEISEDSCAVCLLRLKKSVFPCDKCKLKEYLKKSCDEDSDAPYQIWIKNDDPEPMIRALCGTLKILKAKRRG